MKAIKAEMSSLVGEVDPNPVHMFLSRKKKKKGF